MFWQPKTINYDILVPPLTKSIEEFSASEAETFFVWFQSQIPHRIDYLAKRCAEYLGINKETIDFSSGSLLFIWKWFLEIAETERTPKLKLDHIKANYSNRQYLFRKYLLSQENNQFSLQTEYILRDIGMYIGEVFVRGNPRIHWGYYTEPKTDISVNRPVLLGFEDSRFSPPFPTEFDPIHMVRVQAANIWDNTQKETDLLDLYLRWLKFIPCVQA